MSILDGMRSALATTAVKYAGSDTPLPDLEFVMHPLKRSDAILESRINDHELVRHEGGDYTFLGIPVRADADKDVSNWSLEARQKGGEHE